MKSLKWIFLTIALIALMNSIKAQVTIGLSTGFFELESASSFAPEVLGNHYDLVVNYNRPIAQSPFTLYFNAKFIGYARYGNALADGLDYFYTLKDYYNFSQISRGINPGLGFTFLDTEKIRLVAHYCYSIAHTNTLESGIIEGLTIDHESKEITLGQQTGLSVYLPLSDDVLLQFLPFQYQRHPGFQSFSFGLSFHFE